MHFLSTSAYFFSSSNFAVRTSETDFPFHSQCVSRPHAEIFLLLKLFRRYCWLFTFMKPSPKGSKNLRWAIAYPLSFLQPALFFPVCSWHFSTLAFICNTWQKSCLDKGFFHFLSDSDNLKHVEAPLWRFLESSFSRNSLLNFRTRWPIFQ